MPRAYRRRAPAKKKKKRYVKKGNSYGRMYPNMAKKTAPFRPYLTQNPGMIQGSDACANFLKAQTDPFGQFDVAPGIPDLIATASQKLTLHARGTLSTGGAGDPGTNGEGKGFIIVNPYLIGNAASTIAVANQDYLAPIYTTTSAFNIPAGSNFDPINMHDDTAALNTGVVAHYYPDSPWSTDQLQGTATSEGWIHEGQLDYRIVGCGIKVRNITKPTNRTGTVIIYEDPSNGGTLDELELPADWANGNLWEKIQNDFNQVYGPVDDAFHVSTFKIRTQDDLAYISRWAENQYQGAKDYDNLAILISDANGTDIQTYEWEVTCLVEAVGYRSFGRTVTQCDIGLLSKALNALPAKPTWGSPSASFYAASSKLGIFIITL